MCVIGNWELGCSLVKCLVAFDSIFSLVVESNIFLVARYFCMLMVVNISILNKEMNGKNFLDASPWAFQTLSTTVSNALRSKLSETDSLYCDILY